jgi:hypothetical protein
MTMPSVTRGAFLKNRPPGPPEKLLIALRAVTMGNTVMKRGTMIDRV